MKISVLATICCLLAPALSSHALDDKIRQAVEKGVVTKAFLETLTPDDVPDKWKAQKTTKETDKLIVHTYTREGVKVLEVLWTKEWTGPKEKQFIATVYHDKERLAKILRMSDTTSVVPSDDTEGYQIITSLKDDGTNTVMIMHSESDFLDGIVLKGRETHLLDDLEYTKAVLSMGVVRPMLDSIQEALDKKSKEKTKKEE